MLRKASRNSNAVGKDVPADNPVGTMDRFNEGLKRVLSVQKKATIHKPIRIKRRLRQR
jgi:hypothetical protein